jgi:K+-transporting ATPase A subunit
MRLAMLAFNLLGALAVYGLQRLQSYLPLNPQSFGAYARLVVQHRRELATNTTGRG